MSTSVYTGLNPFTFTLKHFLQICVRNVAVYLQKLLEVMSTSVDTGLNPFNFTLKHFLQICLWDVSYERSYCSFYLIKHTSTVTSTLTTKSTYRSLSAQRLSERTVVSVFYLWVFISYTHIMFFCCPCNWPSCCCVNVLMFKIWIEFYYCCLFVLLLDTITTTTTTTTTTITVAPNFAYSPSSYFSKILSKITYLWFLLFVPAKQ
jgi:hypothetical protein